MYRWHNSRNGVVFRTIVGATLGQHLVMVDQRFTNAGHRNIDVGCIQMVQYLGQHFVLHVVVGAMPAQHPKMVDWHRANAWFRW